MPGTQETRLRWWRKRKTGAASKGQPPCDGGHAGAWGGRQVDGHLSALGQQPCRAMAEAGAAPWTTPTLTCGRGPCRGDNFRFQPLPPQRTKLVGKVATILSQPYLPHYIRNTVKLHGLASTSTPSLLQLFKYLPANLECSTSSSFI